MLLLLLLLLMQHQHWFRHPRRGFVGGARCQQFDPLLTGQVKRRQMRLCPWEWLNKQVIKFTQKNLNLDIKEFPPRVSYG